MKIREIRQPLVEFAEVFASSGATSQAKDIYSFLRMFDGHDDESVDEFASYLEERLRNKETPKNPEFKINPNVVDGYVKKLEHAGTDKGLFDPVFAELISDKAVLKDEADAIAHKYTSGREKWKSKKEAFDEIKTSFEERSYQAAKMVQVSKASRW
jgi:hypothetical protein